MKNAVLVGSLLSLASPALADTVGAKADCLLTSSADLGGAVWTAHASGDDQSSSVLTSWWQKKAASVWLKHGYSLEAYSEPRFFGNVLVLNSDSARGHVTADGVYFNLAELGYASQLASFRCHVTAKEVATIVGRLPWIEGGSYYWRPSADYNDYSTILTEQMAGDYLVRIAYHSFQGSTESYLVNLSKGTVDGQTHTYWGRNEHAHFVFSDGTSKVVSPQYTGMASSAFGWIAIHANGEHAETSFEAPSPELQSIADALTPTLSPTAK